GLPGLPGVQRADIHAQRAARVAGAPDHLREVLRLRTITGGVAGREQVAKGREARVQRALAQQKAHDLPVELEIACEERRALLVAVAQDVQQPVTNERSLRAETRTLADLLGGGRAEQVQREVNTRAAAAHVILQIGVKLPVAAVKLRRE